VLFVFSITLPFFALVLLGFTATWRKILPLASIPGLNAFVLYFALPCMLFRFGASTPITQLLDLNVALVYLPCAFIMVGFTIAITRSNRINWNNAALGALVAAFPNTGFMGLPILIAFLGTAAAGPTIITIVIDMVVTTSFCIVLSRLDAAGDQGALVAFKKALVGMLSNPMPWSILLGATSSALELELLGPAAKTVELLGLAASPVALFTIGAVLARSSMDNPTSLPLRANTTASVWRQATQIAMFKLFLHPLLVLLAGSIAIQNGAKLSTFALTVIVLVAALPSASNVSLLAEKFGADNGRIARIILVSTAVSFLTFSGAAALLL
jgi:malonate transporter and related proteins